MVAPKNARKVISPSLINQLLDVFADDKLIWQARFPARVEVVGTKSPRLNSGVRQQASEDQIHIYSILRITISGGTRKRIGRMLVPMPVVTNM